MRAIVYKKFGPPEVMQLQDIPKPRPKENEVLVKVYASTVTHEEPAMRNAPGFNGLTKPKNPVLGEEFAGVIEATGEAVHRFKTGDRVYGIIQFGSHAEYMCIQENQAIVTIPEGISYIEAAAIPNGTLTALPFLRDGGNIRKGQKILINGASGCVGSAAVQLAKYYGSEVTGVCSKTNIELVKSLGADHVIDYMNKDFTELDETYDIIFDTVGKSSFTQCKGVLNPGGIYLTTTPDFGTLIRMLPGLRYGNKKAKLMATGLRSADKKAKDLLFINQLVQAGTIRAVIDRIYPLEKIIDAHKYVEQGHKKGNVVIKNWE